MVSLLWLGPQRGIFFAQSARGPGGFGYCQYSTHTASLVKHTVKVTLTTALCTRTPREVKTWPPRSWLLERRVGRSTRQQERKDFTDEYVQQRPSVSPGYLFGSPTHLIPAGPVTFNTPTKTPVTPLLDSTERLFRLFTHALLSNRFPNHASNSVAFSFPHPNHTITSLLQRFQPLVFPKGLK